MPRENSTMAIRDIFVTPGRFYRSTNLEKDFADPKALESYTLTPFVVEAFKRIVDGAALGSGRRAWRITGDYGVGKSSFALFLSQFLADPKSRQVAALFKQADIGKLPKIAPMIPILVTGERERLTTSIARAIGVSFAKAGGRRPSKALANLLTQAEKVRRNGTAAGFMDLLDSTLALAVHMDMGVLLILDEMGKFLEHAANQPESEDIFLLQTLSERAVRSGKTPLVFVGLLHQGFHAYSDKLPHAQRHEWEKIAGRFEEVVFDQPLTHTSALAVRALSIKQDLLPKAVKSEARREMLRSMDSGWFARGTSGDPASLYPLHPMVLPLLIRFFARFGQHERSLFGFLLSNEPFGLQAFSDQPVAADLWYRIPDFFDYVRAAFGHRLSGESYRSSWLRLLELVDRAHGLPKAELDTVKTVAILNLLDADDLMATEDVIAASLGHTASMAQSLLKEMVEKGVLFRRGQGGGYRLWGVSNVNLRKALEDAFAALGEAEDVATQLVPHLDSRPIAARRHYLTTGTLRYFDVRYVAVADLQPTVGKRPDADGIIIVALPQTEGERSLARLTAKTSDRGDALVVVPGVLSGLSADLRDVRAWQFVIANTAELADDAYALAEADRQFKRASAQLAAALEEAIGIRSSLSDTAEVYRNGSRLALGASRRLAPIISEACDEIYTQSPKIMNELLNRNLLSSAASAARMRLIEGLFLSPDKPLMGIDDARTPPEKSMYLSVLSAGNVHRFSRGRHFIEEPAADSDPLRLRPALTEIVAKLEAARGARIGVDDVLARLRGAPFGVRDGVSPLLLAVVISTRAHEIAVYERGTFLHNFGPADFLRLTKQPDAFELQLCRVAGIRAEVFRRLLDCFSKEQPSGRQSELLDVVTPLCRFAAQLPEYTRRSIQLDAEAVRVRDVLLTSTDPSSMLFKELPEACGVKAFDVDGRRDLKRTETFVIALHQATDRLRDAYPELLTRVVADVGRALDAGEGTIDRGKIATRAARVALAAREGRLRAFAQRLRDPGLSEDGWIEALASFVVSKPPSRWIKIDVDNWRSEIESLGQTFLATEAAAFSSGPDPVPTAVRFGITRADGTEIARVVDVGAAEDKVIIHVVDQIEAILSESKAARIPVLYRLLWDALSGPQSVAVEDKKARGKSRQ